MDTEPFGAGDRATPFDVCAELPTGTTVLEASAGTGKTYAIAGLAARYIADGMPLSSLMMITFGRMATNELRTRVRERLVSVEVALSACLTGDGATAESAAAAELDEVRDLLCTGSAEELRLRHRRIRVALADFDAATIATTHEFCQTMLNELGVLGDHEPDATFVDSLADLVREVATDCYLQRFAADRAAPPFDFDEALRIATAVIDSGAVPLVPEPEPEDGRMLSEAAQRYGFATDVREQLRIRKQRRRLYSYDDMLTRLQRTLHDPVHGPLAAERLRDRYQVVLVDEFQDTDPVQWDILRTAFGGHATLILIGDPKQAIYAFRGADVYSYLDAVTEADRVGTLTTNWRSDDALVQSLEQLIGEVALGDDRIAVRAVRASHRDRRLRCGCQDQQLGPDQPIVADSDRHADHDRLLAPIRIRFQALDPAAETLPRVARHRPAIAKDLTADIAALLASGATVEVGEPHPVQPGDIAVLVRKNERAEEIRAALTGAGIPAVVLGASSVYAGELAAEWLTLLAALEQPRQAQVRAAALTGFVGWTMRQLATADETALTDLSAMMRRWSRILSHRGVAACLEMISTETRLQSRMLSVTGGERRLTDLRHIGQSLHAAMTSGQLGVSALVDWLRQRIDEAQNTNLDDRSRRLETDAAAVQILTVHRSKGLQFPIVYLPEIWDRYTSDEDTGRLLQLHDQQAAGDGTGRFALIHDVGGAGGPGRAERLAQYRLEEAGEDLRLAYVALTRAQTQLVLWWMPSVNTPCSALQRLLFRDGPEPEQRYPVNSDPGLLPGYGAPGYSIEPIVDREIADWRSAVAPPATLSRREFTRTLDQDWRRTSYTALTAVSHDSEAASAGTTSEPGGVTSEAESAREDDESHAAESFSELATVRGDDLDAELISPMDELPMGAAFGTIAHAVLEQADPHADDLRAELERRCADELARLPTQPMTAQQLADGLLPSMQTPLGPLADQRRLCDIGTEDRLAELDFELPLAGGDRPYAQVRLGDLAPVLQRHLTDTDPLAEYPATLTEPALAEQPLRGFLTGSIDSVLRVGTPAAPRYLIVDYKTNWLGDPEQRPLPLAVYHPRLLPAAMVHAHYPLQALLYAVALHRFLRWRQPGYRPGDHLGGVLYLFIRGMAGPQTPQVDGVPYGVFSWHPPAALITDLSDLLDHGVDDDQRESEGTRR